MKIRFDNLLNPKENVPVVFYRFKEFSPFVILGENILGNIPMFLLEALAS